MDSKRADQDIAPIYIALTCDAVYDYFDRSFWPQEKEPPLSWKGVEEGIELILETVRSLRDSFGRAPVFTWFIPVDNVIDHYYGDVAYLLDAYHAIWSKCAENGGEIAWHVYERVNDAGRWYPEDSDERWNEGLHKAYEAWRKRGIEPHTTRIGGTFCTNSILRTLETLGITCDMTALPGRVRREGRVQLDWEPTPKLPYYPSRTDYRVPGVPFYNVLEVPFSMVAVNADYDKHPFPRYIDLAFHHDALWPGIDLFFQEEPQYLQAIVHPSAVLESVYKDRHGLLAFNIADFKMNMDHIAHCCEKTGRPFRFVTSTELASAFSKSTIIGESPV